MSALSLDERRRYGRHLLLPEVGVAGQEVLKRSRVLLVGAGGLGAPAAMYLAAAGVGTLGLVDHDTVDLSNLQRQLLYRDGDVGRPKLDAARTTLAGVNPLVEVVPHDTWLTRHNALEILGGYDVVVNGCDNFPTRYLINDACVLLRKPCVDGSIYRFEGQVTVYDPAAGGPCYRCRFPEPPPPDLVPNCAEAGVFGVVAGIIGTLQAAEVLKVLWQRAGLPRMEPLVGRLLMLDVLSMDVFNFELRRDPACPVCGERPTLTELIDYDQFCQGQPTMTPDDRLQTMLRNPAAHEVTAVELRDRLATGEDLLVLDVREPWEYDTAHLPGTLLIPLGQLAQRAGELPTDKPIVAHCHHGVRSLQAAALLADLGHPAVKSLRGGIDAWSLDVDPAVPRY